MRSRTSALTRRGTSRNSLPAKARPFFFWGANQHHDCLCSAVCASNVLLLHCCFWPLVMILCNFSCIVAVCCSVLQCVVVRCSVLWCPLVTRSCSSGCIVASFMCVRILYYRVAKTHRIPYLCRSFSTKVTYI